MSDTIQISTEEKKTKIRERYKGISIDNLDVIPAIPTEDFYDETKIKRVGVYARVSTDDPRQTSSYELQKNHYHDMVNRRPDWKLVEIYADEGISGTSLKHRDDFLRMISDCEAGKLDLIVTKSVARFARNVVDCIGYVRALAAMNPPIGVFFETENIYTLNPNAEMSLSFISTLAQEESHTKSEIMNASIEMRFQRGIFLLPVLLGFDHDENNDLIVNHSEARIVRLCFFDYYLGQSSNDISERLVKLKCKSKRGNICWSPSVVLSILQNERYCGDVLARKTFTPNYLNHKSRRNRQDRNQYRQRDHHEAIIPRDIFIAVQHMITNRKYGRQSHLPNLFVISIGMLKGFVSINPRWSFRIEDYINASISVYDDIVKIQSKPLELRVNPGDFDLSNYEVTNSIFINSKRFPALLLSHSQLRFSLAAIQLLGGCPYIQILIHPGKYQLIIKPATERERNAIKWSDTIQGKIIPKFISGSAFIPTLYKLCGWNASYKYRMVGSFYRTLDTSILFFDLRDTEILISIDEYDNKSNIDLFVTKKYVKAYPIEWCNSFGKKYFESSQDFLFKDLYSERLEFVPYYASCNHVKSYTTEQLTQEVERIVKELEMERDNEHGTEYPVLASTDTETNL